MSVEAVRPPLMSKLLSFLANYLLDRFVHVSALHPYYRLAVLDQVAVVDLRIPYEVFSNRLGSDLLYVVFFSDLGVQGKLAEVG